MNGVELESTVLTKRPPSRGSTATDSSSTLSESKKLPERCTCSRHHNLSPRTQAFVTTISAARDVAPSGLSRWMRRTYLESRASSFVRKFECSAAPSSSRCSKIHSQRSDHSLLAQPLLGQQTTWGASRALLVLPFQPSIGADLRLMTSGSAQ